MTAFYLTLADTLATAMLYSSVAGIAIYGLLVVMLQASKNSYSRVKHNLCYMASCFLLVAFLYPFARLLIVLDKPVTQISHTQYTNIENGVAILQTHRDTASNIADAGAHIPNDYSYLVVLFYAIGLCVFAMRLMIAQFHTYTLRRKYISVADERWVTSLKAVCDKLQIEKRINIAFSGIVNSPCVIGYAKALILIPVNLAGNMSIDEIEAILLHELAHIKRYDHYLNLAMQLIKCLLFFNPFMWLVMRRLEYYRELACDETAAVHNNDVALATSLVKISQLQAARPTMALHFFNNHQTLFHRIQNLLSMKDQRKNTRIQASFFTGALTFTIAILLLFTSPTLSQDNIKNRLQQVSDEMYRNNNSDFALVDAMNDGLIKADKHYNLVYDHGKVSIDGKMLPEPYQRRYSKKMTSFYETHGSSANSWTSQRGGGYNIKDILNPESKFRKKHATEDETAQMEHPNLDDADNHYQRKIVSELLKDGIVKKSKPLTLKYNIHGVYVNGKKLEGQAAEKYTKLFAEGSHIIPKQESDGVDISMDGNDVSSTNNTIQNVHEESYNYAPTPPVSPTAPIPVKDMAAVQPVIPVAPVVPVTPVEALTAPEPPTPPVAPVASASVAE